MKRLKRIVNGKYNNTKKGEIRSVRYLSKDHNQYSLFFSSVGIKRSKLHLNILQILMLKLKYTQSDAVKCLEDGSYEKVLSFIAYEPPRLSAAKLKQGFQYLYTGTTHEDKAIVFYHKISSEFVLWYKGNVLKHTKTLKPIENRLKLLIEKYNLIFIKMEKHNDKL